MLTVYTEKHRLRDAATELCGGELVPPFECPVRAEHVLARVREVGLGEIIEPTEYGLEPVLRVHGADFIRFLENCWQEWTNDGYKGEAIATCWPSRHLWQQRPPTDIDGKIGFYAMAAETSINEGTWEAARAASDVALSAAQLISDGARSAFALCRPPGHHASPDQFGGYCFINNAAVAAQWSIDGGAKRVALLDVDFHHGNGSQAIFYHRDDVLFLSLHGDPRDAFPYFLGFADEHGRGDGEGFNVNYPLPPGTGYDRWGAILDQACQRIANYNPDMLVVSLGVDTFAGDPISFFTLTSDDFSRYGEKIGALGLPTLYVMEGGYAVDEIGINAVNVLSGHEHSGS